MEMDEVNVKMEGPNKCGEIYVLCGKTNYELSIKCDLCSGSNSFNLQNYGLHWEREHLGDLLRPSVNFCAEAVLSNREDNEAMYSAVSEIIIKEEILDTISHEDPLLEHQLSKNIVSSAGPKINNGGQDLDHRNDTRDELEDEDTNDSNGSNDMDCNDDVWIADEDTDDSEDEQDEEEFIHNSDRNLIDLLIKAFKNEEVLWSRSGEHSDFSIKEKAYADILEQLNEIKPVELDNRKLQSILRYFKKVYWTCLESKDEPKPWYYRKLTFLKKSSKEISAEKKKSRRGRKRKSLVIPTFTESETVQFINIYKGFTCLWDMNHFEFRIPEQRKHALEAMLDALQKQFHTKVSQINLDESISHIRMVCVREKRLQLECERLGKPYEPFSQFAKHLEFLLPHVGPFKCPICAVLLKSGDSFLIHKSEHEGSLPFICPICQKSFKKNTPLLQHIRRHTKDYVHKCEMCGKGFATTSEKKVHMRMHTGEQPFFCEICGHSFKNYSYFAVHKKRHLKQANHKCTLCEKSFYTSSKLKYHMNAHLGVRDRVCDTCGKGFADPKHLSQHKKLHLEEKEYKCKLCPMEFAQFAGLHIHMKSH